MIVLYKPNIMHIKKPPIKKYRYNQHIESETYQQYLERAHKRNPIKDMWIYELLKTDKHKEILYSDNQFVLIKPTKSTDMHLLGFVRDINIRTMRDLDERHIPLLEHIYEGGCLYFKEKYNINKDKLKIYVHYPPTTWVLHVHFTLIDNIEVSSSVEHTYSLSEIINILRIRGDYYQTTIMNCLVNE